jgi:very-short-patch-repair endonuclease
MATPAKKKAGASPWWSRGETPALVGIVNRRKDWLLLETQHWYRIPRRSFAEGLPAIRYLAFYQTKAFGDEKWSVNCCAEVKRISTVKRIELLPEEPNHRRANEPYYRIQVGELLRLPRPIPSRRWRRIVFIPTSLERLLVAQEINDLFRTSPIEDRLYSELKDARLPAERQLYVREPATGYMLDLALFCRDGPLDVECDGEAYHSGEERAQADRERDNALTADGWRHCARHRLDKRRGAAVPHSACASRGPRLCTRRTGVLRSSGARSEDWVGSNPARVTPDVQRSVKRGHYSEWCPLRLSRKFLL